MVDETFAPVMTVSLLARQHGVAPNQLFTWRRLVAQNSLTAAGRGEEVVPTSDYRALQNQVRELHRLLGKMQGVCARYLMQSVSTYPACGKPRRRWRSVRPSPHKQHGFIAPFF
jgi:transposase